MSLKIEKKNTETKTLALIGRLDTVTAPELEAEISNHSSHRGIACA